MSRVITEEAVELLEANKVVRVRDGSQRALRGKEGTKTPPSYSKATAENVQQYHDTGESVTAEKHQARLTNRRAQGENERGI